MNTTNDNKFVIAIFRTYILCDLDSLDLKTQFVNSWSGWVVYALNLGVKCCIVKINSGRYI